MLKKTLLLVVLSFFLNVPSYSQNPVASLDSNMTKVSHLPGGACYGLAPFGDQYVLIGSGRGIRIVDVSNKANPLTVAQVSTQGSVSDVFVEGNFAFITTDGSNGAYVSEDFPGGVTIVDISSPQAPQVLSFFNANEQCLEIYVSGNYAYVGAVNKVIVLDVSNPSAPLKVAQISLGNSPHGIFVAGNYLYVSAQSAALNIFSLSDPAHPTAVGSYTGAWAENVFVQDTLAFVTQQSEVVKIVSVADPSNPTFVGEVNGISFDQFYGAITSGNHLFLSGWGQAGLPMLKIYDISNLSNPQLEGEYYDSTDVSGSDIGFEMSISGNYLALASYAGLSLFDIHDLTHPTRLSFYAADITVEGIKVVGDYLYCLFNQKDNGGLSIVDISNPQYFKEVSRFFPSRAGYFNSFNSEIVVSGNYAYYQESGYPDTCEGLHIVNIADPANPTEVAFFQLASPSNLLAKKGDYLYTATPYITDSLQVINVSDPAAPKLVGRFWFDSWTFGASGKFVVEGDYLYIGSSKGLVIFSVADPSNPIYYGFYQLRDNFYSVRGIKVDGTTAYLATESGLVTVNVADPHNPTERAYIHANYYLDVETIGSDIFVAAYAQGINIFHEADTTFISIGYWNDKSGWATYLETSGDNLFASYDGVMVFHKGRSSDVKGSEREIPKEFELFQNYPNPFNPSTVISFALKKSEFVNLKVYDLLGREVAELLNEKMQAGFHKVNFNAANLSAGIYFYRLKAGEFTATKKMILLK